VVSGGEIYEVSVRSNNVRAQLNGPPNTFRRFPTKESLELQEKGRAVSLAYENPKMTQDFTVYLDPKAGAAKFVSAIRNSFSRKRNGAIGFTSSSKPSRT
jgi:hypothetical protein